MTPHPTASPAPPSGVSTDAARLSSRRRLGRAAFATWSTLMAVAFLLPGQQLPAGGFWSLDKAQHTGVFAVWAALARAAGLSAPTTLVAGLAFAAASELAQHLLTALGRAGDPHDALADGIGIVLGIAVAALMDRQGRAGRR